MLPNAVQHCPAQVISLINSQSDSNAHAGFCRYMLTRCLHAWMTICVVSMRQTGRSLVM